MIHKGKPDLELAIGPAPKPLGNETDGEDGEDDYGKDAEEMACKEVWEAIESKDYEAFRGALSAWFDAKEASPHREAPEEG